MIINKNSKLGEDMKLQQTNEEDFDKLLKRNFIISHGNGKSKMQEVKGHKRL